ncbi:transcriptional regulator [Shewanella morhuae]|nr:transcriptional regulator [Shewanella morhuae]
MKDQRKLSYRLGLCRIDPSDNSVVFQSKTDMNESAIEQTKLSLQPKFIEVLNVLARNYPEVVTRDELITQVWDGNSYVGAKALTNAIWHLRQQLSPLAEVGAVIETVRKTGYRLLIEPKFDVEAISEEQDLLQLTSGKLLHMTQRMRVIMTSMALLIFLGMLFTGIHLYQDKQKMLETQVTALTRDPGSERYPVVSHDGRWLVYGAYRPGFVPSLYLKDLTNDDLPVWQLTSSSSTELRAAWSIDDTRLYFTSHTVTTAECRIMQLTLSTNEIISLAPCSSDMSAIDVSPDGKSLAYISSHEKNKMGGIYVQSLGLDNTQLIRQSCEINCSYEDRDLAYSPDGYWMAIVRRYSNISEDIFIRELSSGNEQRLTHGIEDVRGLGWTNDSKRLVFATEESGSRNGFIIDIKSKNISSLDVEGMSYPRLIGDSGELVYHQYHRQFEIAYLSLNNKVPTTLFPLLYSGVNHRNPDYSTQALRLVFVSNESGFNEIWTSDFNGQKLEQHTKLKTRVAYPRWSPDGTKIAFIAPDDNHEGNRIYILDLASKHIIALASTYHNHGRPAWSWQGKSVYASTSAGITEFYLNNQAPRVVNSLNMGVGFASSASELVFTRSDTQGLWLVNLNQPDAVETLIASTDFKTTNNWTLTQEGVYFKSDHIGEQRLNFWDAKSKNIMPVLQVPRSSLSSFGSMAYIPESSRLLMTLDGYPQRDIMLLKHKLIR